MRLLSVFALVVAVAAPSLVSAQSVSEVERQTATLRSRIEANRSKVSQDEAELASAEARVAGAEARVSEARVRLNDPELEFLEREAQRFDELLARGDVAPSERDAAARALASSRFRIEQVIASLPVLEAAVREATANLDSAKAALERSQTALREATILSPIDGVVLVRQ